jgi:hypothetical protein
MKLLNRLLTIAVAGVFVTAAWALVARTGWAAARDYLSAGPGFHGWLEPLATLLGMVLVSVTLTLLTERAWRALFPGRVERPRRAPAQRAAASTPRAV